MEEPTDLGGDVDKDPRRGADVEHIELSDGDQTKPSIRPAKRRRVAPCTNCRYVVSIPISRRYTDFLRTDKHLKCDASDSACRRCRENDEECVRAKSKIKFRTGSSAKYDAAFATDQPWLGSTELKAPLEYIDETAELVAYYAGGGDRDQNSESPLPDQGEDDDLLASQTNHLHSLAVKSPVIRSHAEEAGHDYPAHELWSSPLSPVRSRDLGTSSHYSNPEWDWAKGSAVSPICQFNVPVPPSPLPFLSGLLKAPSEPEAQSDETALQVVLLRFFINELARWFDLCDPEKHFELVVPHRARQCPPLMNAILTASARHLTRLKKYRTASGILFYDGRLLPGLTEETAIHYQNECLRDLIQLSVDPEQAKNENLLAAAIILRFYEEVDEYMREGEDKELFLKAANIFIHAQEPIVPVIPHSSPMVNQPGVTNIHDFGLHTASPKAVNPMGSAHTPSDHSHHSGNTPRVRLTDGLRQAAYWVAFRQEIFSAFLKQRAFNMALSRCESFRSFAPAEDAVWADRLIIFCADALDFCYGESNTKSAKDRWLELKQYLKAWGDVLPPTFEPLYFREPDPLKGQIFPEICYLADCHATGVLHVEMARILLAVYDPTRPKMGPGHIAGMKALTRELKTIVLRVCGIAVSNRMAPPTLTYAFLAISMCGEVFEERHEQEALLAVLEELEREHSRPTSSTCNLLKSAWGWV